MLAVVGIVALACGFLYALDRAHSNDSPDWLGFFKFSLLGGIVAAASIWAYGSPSFAAAAASATTAVEDVFTGLPQF